MAFNPGFRLPTMKPPVKAAHTVLLLALGAALAGCSGASDAGTAGSPADAAAAAEAGQQKPDTEDAQPAAQLDEEPATGCAAAGLNRIEFDHQAGGGPIYAEVQDPIVDYGVNPSATGETTVDANGVIQSYTVAAGDSPIAIGDRFCIDYITVLSLNRIYPGIDPGQVLVLTPDPTVQWGDDTPVEGDKPYTP